MAQGSALTYIHSPLTAAEAFKILLVFCYNGLRTTYIQSDKEKHPILFVSNARYNFQRVEKLNNICEMSISQSLQCVGEHIYE